MPAVSNVVTTRNGSGTKCLKGNSAFGLEVRIQSSVFGTTTVAKVNLFSTWIWSTVSGYSICKRKNRPFKHHTQTNLVYVGVVNVTMIWDSL